MDVGVTMSKGVVDVDKPGTHRSGKHSLISQEGNTVQGVVKHHFRSRRPPRIAILHVGARQNLGRIGSVLLRPHGCAALSVAGMSH
jgi:hypothetical protein